MEIWETNLTGKWVCLYFPRWIQQTHMASSLEDSAQGGPSLQNRDKTTKTPGGRNPNTGHGGPKDHRKRHPRQHQPYDCPTWGPIETLTSQAENLVSQQGMPRSPEYILLAMLSLLARASPIQALTNHTYWAHIPNPSLLHVDRERTNGFN